jgi:hypothetical protein
MVDVTRNFTAVSIQSHYHLVSALLRWGVRWPLTEISFPLDSQIVFTDTDSLYDEARKVDDKGSHNRASTSFRLGRSPFAAKRDVFFCLTFFVGYNEWRQHLRYQFPFLFFSFLIVDINKEWAFGQMDLMMTDWACECGMS